MARSIFILPWTVFAVGNRRIAINGDCTTRNRTLKDLKQSPERFRRGPVEEGDEPSPEQSAPHHGAWQDRLPWKQTRGEPSKSRKAVDRVQVSTRSDSERTPLRRAKDARSRFFTPRTGRTPAPSPRGTPRGAPRARGVSPQGPGRLQTPFLSYVKRPHPCPRRGKYPPAGPENIGTA